MAKAEDGNRPLAAAVKTKVGSQLAIARQYDPDLTDTCITGPASLNLCRWPGASIVSTLPLFAIP